MKKLLALLFFFGGLQLQGQTIVQEIFNVGGASHVSDMDVPKPTRPGSTLIAMPGPVSPSVKVMSITDNAPTGSNLYKQVPGAASSCGKQSLDIWYCEKCNPGVTELKYHFSGHVMSVNTFIEVADLALSSPVDGSGANVTDGTGSSEGVEAGPSLKTTATDFIIARYASAVAPSAVTPAPWTLKSTYVYAANAPTGTHQPTLTGGGPAGSFCMSAAAFKSAASGSATPGSTVAKHAESGSELFSDNQGPKF
ncbi:MAG TPA: hypothetical protein VH079_00745 [Terriglobales bacterium]|jgi:hypothetical protein|nr:hypothetical protein [Terriglobales bacterium]